MEQRPEHPGGAVWHSVAMADRLFKLKLKHRLAELGVSTAEAMALVLLAHAGDGKNAPGETARKQEGGMSQDRMISALHYDKGFMTRTMRKLSDQGLVLKGTNPDDARSVVYSLAPEGRSLVSGIARQLEDWEQNLTRGLTREQLDSFAETLSLLVSNANQDPNPQSGETASQDQKEGE